MIAIVQARQSPHRVIDVDQELREAGLVQRGEEIYEASIHTVTPRALEAVRRNREYIPNWRHIEGKLEKMLKEKERAQRTVRIEIDDGRILFNTRVENEKLKRYLFATRNHWCIRLHKNRPMFTIPTRYFYWFKRELEKEGYTVEYEWKVKPVDLREARDRFKKKYRLWEWQILADDAWNRRRRRGCVVAASASGKTVFAINEIISTSVKTALSLIHI